MVALIATGGEHLGGRLVDNQLLVALEVFLRNHTSLLEVCEGYGVRTYGKIVASQDGALVGLNEDSALQLFLVHSELDAVAFGAETSRNEGLFSKYFAAVVATVPLAHFGLLPLLLDDVLEFRPLVALFQHLGSSDFEVDFAGLDGRL